MDGDARESDEEFEHSGKCLFVKYITNGCVNFGDTNQFLINSPKQWYHVCNQDEPKI